MKLLVVGASQGVGALTVRAGLDGGHEVTAFARSPQKLSIDHPSLTRIVGNFHDAASVDAAVPGHDAIIVTASASTLKGFKDDPTFFSRGTSLVVDAMQRHRVRRLVVLSALGTGDTRVLFNFILRGLLLDLVLKRPYEDHERQEALVRSCGLDWVIARPSKLTSGAGRKRYKKTTRVEAVPSSISRADVADFLVEACVSDAWVGHSVLLGG